MEKLHNFINKVLEKLHLIKYKEIILYLIVGGLTTVVDWVVFTLFKIVIPAELPKTSFLYFISPNIIPYTLGWVCAVLFAFWANKFLVFESKGKGATQFLPFVGSRVLTLGISLLFDFVFTSETVGLKWNAFLVKVISSIVVIILNYVFGKLIFKKKKTDNKPEKENEEITTIEEKDGQNNS